MMKNQGLHKDAFNLVVEAWIPVILPTGNATLSLANIFKQSSEIVGLSGKPIEKISLLRLLLCITQAALPVKTEEFRSECLPKIVPAVLRYLEKHKTSFNLLGDDRRFLQLDDLTLNKTTTNISKLFPTVPTGHNAIVFDHEASNADREFSNAELALALLTFQNFSVGGRISSAKWNRHPTEEASAKDAPCVAGSPLHVFLQESNLLETIHANLISERDLRETLGQDLGRPVWEQMPSGKSDKQAIANATTTYLGRLVPLCRAVRLLDGQNILLGAALTYPGAVEIRLSSVSVIRKKDKELTASSSLTRSIWRQLPSLLEQSTDKLKDGTIFCPPTLSRNFKGLWVGGIVRNQSKYEGQVESTFKVHFDGLLLGRFRKMIADAEVLERGLDWAVKSYYKELGVGTDAWKVSSRTVGHYWSSLDVIYPQLLQILADDNLALAEAEKHCRSRMLELAKRASLTICCPQTSRQKAAWNRNEMKINFILPKTPKASKTTEEASS